MYRRPDPGPCPICGAAHTACTTDTGPGIAIPQLPERDAAPLAVAGPPEDHAFTTGTYVRAKHNPGVKRKV